MYNIKPLFSVLALCLDVANRRTLLQNTLLGKTWSTKVKLFYSRTHSPEFQIPVFFRRVAGSLRLSFHCPRFHGFLEQTANSPDNRVTLIGYLMTFSLMQQKMCDPSFPKNETLLKSRMLKELIYNKRFLWTITSLQPNITRFNDWVSVSEKLTRNANFFPVKYVNKISYVCLKTKLKTNKQKKAS